MARDMGRVDPRTIGARLFADEMERRRKIFAAVIEAAHFALDMLMRPAAPKDMGHLQQSGHVDLTGKGADIIFDAPHSAHVEMGTRPHRVPIGPLIDWVWRHRGLFDIEDNEVFGVARGIQAKIAREGTKPHWFVKANLPGARIALGKLIAAALGK